jgi:hypothetical protein
VSVVQGEKGIYWLHEWREQRRYSGRHHSDWCDCGWATLYREAPRRESDGERMEGRREEGRKRRNEGKKERKKERNEGKKEIMKKKK